MKANRDLTLPVLLAEPTLALELPRADAARLLAQMGALAEILRVAAAMSATPSPPPPEREPSRSADRWLTVAQVAERLGRDKRWVYRRARSWDFTAKDGKSLAFSERGLVAYMERHRLRNRC